MKHFFEYITLKEINMCLQNINILTTTKFNEYCDMIYTCTIEFASERVHDCLSEHLNVVNETKKALRRKVSRHKE